MTDKYDYLKHHYSNSFATNQETTMSTSKNLHPTNPNPSGVWAAGSDWVYSNDHKLFHSELEALRYAVGKYQHVFFVPDGSSVRDVLETLEQAKLAEKARAELDPATQIITVNDSPF